MKWSRHQQRNNAKNLAWHGEPKVRPVAVPVPAWLPACLQPALPCLGWILCLSRRRASSSNQMPPQCPLNFLGRAAAAAAMISSPATRCPVSLSLCPLSPCLSLSLSIVASLAMCSFFNSTDCTAASGIRHFLKPHNVRFASRRQHLAASYLDATSAATVAAAADAVLLLLLSLLLLPPSQSAKQNEEKKFQK